MTGSGPSARFSDGKDPGALRTIGEVGSALGIKQHVLRYWEQQFPMLKPLKRSGGRRYYRPTDRGFEKEIKRRLDGWEKIKNERKQTRQAPQAGPTEDDR